VVPALLEDCPAVLALRAEGLRPEVVIMADDLAYGRLLAALWTTGEGFILVEHDIVPWPGALARLATCSASFCAYRYPLGGSTGCELGCVRFGTDLLRSHPDLPIAWSGVTWQYLDTRLFKALRACGHDTPHVHEPAVAHLNPK
jgi:hypothetical protein